MVEYILFDNNWSGNLKDFPVNKCPLLSIYRWWRETLLLIAKGIAKDNKTEIFEIATLKACITGYYDERYLCMANVGIITQYVENTVCSDNTDAYIVNTVKITVVLW